MHGLYGCCVLLRTAVCCCVLQYNDDSFWEPDAYEDPDDDYVVADRSLSMSTIKLAAAQKLTPADRKCETVWQEWRLHTSWLSPLLSTSCIAAQHNLTPAAFDQLLRSELLHHSFLPIYLPTALPLFPPLSPPLALPRRAVPGHGCDVCVLGAAGAVQGQPHLHGGGQDTRGALQGQLQDMQPK